MVLLKIHCFGSIHKADWDTAQIAIPATAGINPAGGTLTVDASSSFHQGRPIPLALVEELRRHISLGSYSRKMAAGNKQIRSH